MVFDADAGKIDCPVYAREDLLAGDVVQGPAVIGQSDTTVLLTPGQAGTVDAHGVIHICTKRDTP
jgi:N-methylhydantoinase A